MKAAIRIPPELMSDQGFRRKFRVYLEVDGIPKFTGCREELLAEIAGREKISLPTLRRWLRTVKDAISGTGRLAAKYDGNKEYKLPTSRAFDVPAIKFGIGCWLRNMVAGKRAAYQAMLDQALEEGWRVGDYTSFTRLLKKVPPAAIEVARRGAVGAKLAIAPKVIRKWLDTPVLGVLCGDQKILDYKVVNTQTGEVHIMNLYLWMDCTSRFWTGIWPSLGPYNKYTVGFSLRESCVWGSPKEIYTDWGKPETSGYVDQVITGLNDLFMANAGDWQAYRQRYAAFDQADRRMAQAGVPWTKPIENQMNIIDRELAARFTPGFRKRDMDAWVNKCRNAELKHQRKIGRLMSIEEMLELLREIWLDHNHKPTRIGELHGGEIIPAEIFSDGVKDRHAIHKDTLDLVFMPRFMRKHKASTVTIKLGAHDVRRFFAPEFGRYDRDKVYQVAVNPFSLEAPAIIFDEKGGYLFPAHVWEMASSHTEDKLRKQLQEQNRIMRYWKQLLNDLRADFDQYRGPESNVRLITPADRSVREIKKAEQAEKAFDLDRGRKKGADILIKKHLTKEAI